MKPRDRVMQSLNHKEPDRVPIDMGATIVSSIVKKTYIELKTTSWHAGRGDQDAGLCAAVALSR